MTRSYPAQPGFGVGAVMFEGDKVVLVRRGQPPLDGQCTLPGGMVEVGETIEQALIREVEEETGWIVRVVKQVALFDFIEKDARGRIRYHYILADFLCQRTEGDLMAGSDAKEVRLVPLDELADYQLTPKALEVIREAWKISK
jgi:mutator protein MutT